MLFYLDIFQNLGKERIGKVTEEYANYAQKEEIGRGGFGRVYRLRNSKLVIKEEYKVLKF